MKTNAVTLRPTIREDYPKVQALLADVGWPVRSQEGWDWAFENNPDRVALECELGVPVASGWVLESDEGIHGYLGNLPQSFSIDNTRVVGATCTSYLVQKMWRAHSVKLMRAFFTQPGVQMVYSTTANANSVPLYKLYKAETLADPKVTQSLLWVASDRSFIEFALRRKGLTAFLPFGKLLAPVLHSLRTLVGYASPPAVAFGGAIRQLQASDVGDAFDDLWQTVKEQPGLWLARNKELVQWRYSNPDTLEDMVLLGAFEREILVGYLIAKADRKPNDKVSRVYLLDMVVNPNASQNAAPCLMHKLCGWAKAQDLPWVEAPRFGGTLGEQLRNCQPHVRQLALTSHYLRVFDKAVQEKLQNGPAWPCSAVDGDAWLGMTDHTVRSNRIQWKATTSNLAPTHIGNQIK